MISKVSQKDGEVDGGCKPSIEIEGSTHVHHSAPDDVMMSGLVQSDLILTNKTKYHFPLAVIVVLMAAPTSMILFICLKFCLLISPYLKKMNNLLKLGMQWGIQ